jgi:hypothetical protein
MSRLLPRREGPQAAQPGVRSTRGMSQALGRKVRFAECTPEPTFNVPQTRAEGDRQMSEMPRRIQMPVVRSTRKLMIGTRQPEYFGRLAEAALCHVCYFLLVSALR